MAKPEKPEKPGTLTYFAACVTGSGFIRWSKTGERPGFF
jgi:hypothetical protein